MVKNLPASARDIRDAGLIPGSGRSLEEGMATHSSILAWRIPWIKEPGGVAESQTRLKQLSSGFVIAFLPRSKRFLISWL